MAEFLGNFLIALLMLGAANGAPIVMKKWLDPRLAHPLDGGLRFFDGRPLLGSSKTWRGLIAAIVVGTLVAPAVGLAWHTGALFGAGAMAGDLLSSFIKRRLGRPPSSQAIGLDQIPESLIPLYLCRDAIGLDAAEIAILVTLFLVLELGVSRVLYRLRVRDEPY